MLQRNRGEHRRDRGKELLRAMFTAAISEEDLSWIAGENLALPRVHAADLHYNSALLDWRDTIQRITLPTFVIGAEKSIFSAESQRWIADVIPGAELSIFPRRRAVRTSCSLRIPSASTPR